MIKKALICGIICACVAMVSGSVPEATLATTGTSGNNTTKISSESQKDDDTRESEENTIETIIVPDELMTYRLVTRDIQVVPAALAPLSNEARAKLVLETKTGVSAVVDDKSEMDESGDTDLVKTDESQADDVANEEATNDVEASGDAGEVVEESAEEADESTNGSTGESIKSDEKYYAEDDIVMLAKLITAEAGGIPSKMEQAAVAWTVLNRVDSAQWPDTISGVVTQPNQFAYYSGKQYFDVCYEVAADVLERWNQEKNGATDVGRVLPGDYMYFTGDGSHNHFRNSSGTRWNWSYENPYES